MASLKNAIKRTEREIAKFDDSELSVKQAQIRRRALECWKLRLMGYTLLDICEELGLSLGVVQRSVEIAKEEFPSVTEDVATVREMCVYQLCESLKWAQTVEPDEDRYPKERIRIQVVDQLSKMFGLNSQRIELSQVDYKIVGIDTKELS